VSIDIDMSDEPVPDSKPSGIGQKYVPKEEGAPAVMLGADVQAIESGEQARLEAEHRARRAPTIVRMQAFDLPPPAAKAGADGDFTFPKRRRSGVVAGVGAALVGAVVLLVAVTRSPSKNEPEPSGTATNAATVAPDTAAPAPPPPATTTQPSSVEHGDTPSKGAVPGPAAAAPTAAATDATSKPVKPAPTQSKLSAPAPKPIPAKPPSQPKTAATPKPAAQKAGSSVPRPASGKSMIVRENPF
jgi:hypothetical protein